MEPPSTTFFLFFNPINKIFRQQKKQQNFKIQVIYYETLEQRNSIVISEVKKQEI